LEIACVPATPARFVLTNSVKPFPYWAGYIVVSIMAA
jgi:hypothetical protein